MWIGLTENTYNNHKEERIQVGSSYISFWDYSPELNSIAGKNGFRDTTEQPIYGSRKIVVLLQAVDPKTLSVYFSPELNSCSHVEWSETVLLKLLDFVKHAANIFVEKPA